MFQRHQLYPFNLESYPIEGFYWKIQLQSLGSLPSVKFFSLWATYVDVSLQSMNTMQFYFDLSLLQILRILNMN